MNEQIIRVRVCAPAQSKPIFERILHVAVVDRFDADLVVRALRLLFSRNSKISIDYEAS